MGQRVLRGPGCLREVPDLIATHGCRRVLVVHRWTSLESSSAIPILESSETVQFEFLGDVPPNPEVGTISRCHSRLIDTAPDTIIAIGGGSVLDTAKALIAFASGATEVDVLSNGFDPGAARPRFWAAPTTAGSGSEATHFAVLYKGGAKYSIAHPSLRPDVTFLDPEQTLSCPRWLTLASGSDAVCQAVESHWSRGATAESGARALEALELLLDNLLPAVDAPGEIGPRAAMLYGANLAGRAIDISKTTGGHAMSYGLTSRFGMPHGLAVLTVMQPLVRLMASKYGFFREPTGLDAAFRRFGQNFPEAFETFSREVWTRLGDRSHVPAAAPDRGPGAVAALASGVNLERLSNHPVRLMAEDIEAIYGTVLEGLGSDRGGPLAQQE